MWPWSGFGASLALSDDYLVVGGPYFDEHVSIFTADSNYNDYTMKFAWTPGFGGSVAICGDYFAVSNYENAGEPKVWLLHNTGNLNLETVRIFDNPSGTQGSKFGERLALTDTDLFVSSTGLNYVSIFNNWKSENWTTQTVNKVGGYKFGKSLAYNGQTLFVGDPEAQFEDSSATGAVYAYVQDSSGNWVQADVIRPSDNDEYGYYGQSIGATASDLIVGWPYAGVPNYGRTGAAYVYALGAGGSGGTSKPTVTVTFPKLVSYNGVPGIYGSLSGKGLVTLSSAAPAGGTTLNLNSTSGHLTVPATVTVAAGETTAEFTFTTEYVNSDSDGLVQASGTGVTGGDCTVKVLANKVVKISGVTLNNWGTGTGTVKLAVPAASDYTVYLASENPNLLYVPDSVTVPAGSLSAQFQAISNNPVSQLTEVYVSAGPANGVKRAKFTIRPEVQISSVQLNDSVILAGTQTIGTVFLEGPAPAGGQVVALSSNRSAVSVPASVTVPEGMMSAEFSIQSTGSAATSATITAKNSNGFKKTATLNLVRPRLASVSLSQSTAKGGSEYPTVTVSLTQAVPFDVTISLSSNQRTVASVPEFITIPAWEVSASGEVTTFKPGKDKTVVISARYKADSPKNVALKVTK